MNLATKGPIPRMSAEGRRELVLAAAMVAFGRSGYAGTTTADVAEQAGVSQPYVVRIFGTKLDLFLEVLDRSTGQIIKAFREVLAEGSFDPDNEDDWDRLGSRYSELVLADRPLLQVMVHGFAASGEPEIGAKARARMGEIFEILRSTGCTDEAARDFIAQGMLINIMLMMNAPEHAGDGDALAALSTCAFGDTLLSL